MPAPAAPLLHRGQQGQQPVQGHGPLVPFGNLCLQECGELLLVLGLGVGELDFVDLDLLESDDPGVPVGRHAAVDPDDAEDRGFHVCGLHRDGGPRLDRVALEGLELRLIDDHARALKALELTGPEVVGRQHPLAPANIRSIKTISRPVTE